MSKRERRFHDGRADGLRPLNAIDLDDVQSFSDLVRAMRDTAFNGRQLGRALEILTTMARDPECVVVMTVSGAMTVAKQGGIVCELIERGIVDVLISTGAIMAHGLSESVGLTHYAVDPETDDEKLFEKGYNRVYDTLEMEANLNDVEIFVSQALREHAPEGGVWSSAHFCRAVGKYLDEQDEGKGILRSAYRRGVPVFIPAFTDSEVGLDFALFAMRQAQTKPGSKRLAADSWEDVFDHVPAYNPFLDLQEYARLAGGARTLGILTIGGGVPRNWAQQVAPYYDVIEKRLETRMPQPRFKYGVRICPDPPHWGGLSGCTYSEGVSWGKFVPPAEGGRWAEVYADATLVLPLLIKALFEELDSD